jgi:hypothetical protein
MTIQYLIQLKSYFEVSTILTFIYTEIYLLYFLFVSHNNHSVEFLFFLFILQYVKIQINF